MVIKETGKNPAESWKTIEPGVPAKFKNLLADKSVIIYYLLSSSSFNKHILKV